MPHASSDIHAFTPGSLAARGYRMPAEWEPHHGTWLTWPHSDDLTWPDLFEEIPPVYVQKVLALHEHEVVHVNVLDEAHEASVRSLLEEEGVTDNVRFHRFPTNMEWVRDYGAIFVTRESDGERVLHALDWRFNSWGDKYPHDLDDRIPPLMARALGVPRTEVDLVLEGGSIDVNGRGLLLTTTSCLLHPNRNPDRSREEIEQVLRDMLGVRKILWLGDGIVGDDTDGHVDDITRFVGPHTIVTAVEEDPADANYEPLRENLAKLHSMAGADGEALQIVTLPMPGPVEYKGTRLPASYANFYIGNGVVLLPQYRDPNDEVARETLQRLFPRRRVVGIDCTSLIWGLGAFHCLTQQVPAFG